jgi:hypothetical protein
MFFYSRTITSRFIPSNRSLIYEIQYLQFIMTNNMHNCWITERGGESVIEKFNPF